MFDLHSLLDRRNRRLQGWLGCILVGLPLVFFFAGGFGHSVDGDAGGGLFSAGWFREVFVVCMALMLMLGVLFVGVYFTNTRHSGDEDRDRLGE